MTEADVRVIVEQQRGDDVRWLALVIRDAFLVAVRAIEKRYGIDPVSNAERDRIRREAIAGYCARNGIRE